MIKKAIMGALLSAYVFSFTPITVNANVNMGNFKVTYYWPGEDNWGHRTATGVRSSNLYTVAVDPNVIPLGSKILIDGEEYLAVDVGGLVKGDHVDIFTETPIHKTYTAHVEIVR